LKTNYCCRASGSSFSTTFAFNLSSFNLSSFDLSSFDSSSSDFSSSSSSSLSNLFAFVLSIEDLSTRDLSIGLQVDSNKLSIGNNCNCDRFIVSFSQAFALLRCTIRISISKKRYEDRIIQRLSPRIQLSKLIKIE